MSTTTGRRDFPAQNEGAKHAAPSTGYNTKAEADDARTKLAKLKDTSKKLTTILISLGSGGLAFTCVNVTIFATDNHVSSWIAWLLDPLVSLALVAVLWADGVFTEIGGYKPRGWPFILRWFAGLTTWLMNCWDSLYPKEYGFTGIPEHPHAAGIVLHSAIPILVIVLSEAIAGYRKFVSTRGAEIQAVIDSYEAGLKVAAQIVADEKAAEKAEEKRRQQAEDDRARKAYDQEQADKRAARKRQEEREEKERDNALEKERLRIAGEAEAARTKALGEVERVKAEAQAAVVAAQSEAKIKAEQAAAQIEMDKLRFATDLTAEQDEARRERLRKEKEEAEAKEEADRVLAEEKAAAEAARSARLAAEEEAHRENDALIRAARREAARAAAAAESAEAGESDADTGADGMSREERDEQRRHAVEYAAKLQVAEKTITTKALGELYGRGPTWGRERWAEAGQRLKTDDIFNKRMQDLVDETEAGEKMAAAGH